MSHRPPADPRPAGVEVTLDGQAVTVKGPKGHPVPHRPAPITIERSEDGTLLVAVRTTSARAAACTA
jgi:ribosomal protein L6P/L9E